MYPSNRTPDSNERYNSGLRTAQIVGGVGGGLVGGGVALVAGTYRPSCHGVIDKAFEEYRLDKNAWI